MRIQTIVPAGSQTLERKKKYVIYSEYWGDGILNYGEQGMGVKFLTVECAKYLRYR